MKRRCFLFIFFFFSVFLLQKRKISGLNATKILYWFYLSGQAKSTKESVSNEMIYLRISLIEILWIFANKRFFFIEQIAISRRKKQHLR